ncbi:MAG: hypothetical protein R3F05_20240 [Planctomycetota bacterium]
MGPDGLRFDPESSAGPRLETRRTSRLSPLWLTGVGAIVAPALHSATDVMEWMNGGFTRLQLLLNYAAFLPLPAIMLGLHAAQHGRGRWPSLLGALGYGFAFVYFAHTTLLALESDLPTYEDLWVRLGVTYTWHGALMIASGVAFGIASLRARVYPTWACSAFLAGLGVNFTLALLPLPDLLQTVGTLMRNAGLAGMGASLVQRLAESSGASQP